jgi:hypothetical protein
VPPPHRPGSCSPNVATTVSGSPTGFNRIVITGPAGFRAGTERFTVTCLLRANTAMSSMTTNGEGQRRRQALRDLAGNAAKDTQWSFRTR